MAGQGENKEKEISYSSLRPNHFKTIPGAAIPVRGGHAADEKQLVAPHALLLGIKQLVAQMDPFYQTDDHPVIPYLQRPPFLALQTHRRLHDARRLDHPRFASMQPGMDQFILTIRQ